jgi:hypothetical protein
LSPRRRPESNVEFSWERRQRWLTWLSVRHARGFAAFAVVMLAVLGTTSLSDHQRRVHATRAAIVSVQRATEAFRADHTRCPSGVDELVRPPEGTDGPRHYLARVRLDGWGHEFLYTCPGGKFPASADVVSGGPEGSFGLDRVE